MGIANGGNEYTYETVYLKIDNNRSWARLKHKQQSQCGRRTSQEAWHIETVKLDP